MARERLGDLHPGPALAASDMIVQVWYYNLHPIVEARSCVAAGKRTAHEGHCVAPAWKLMRDCQPCTARPAPAWMQALD